MVSCDVFLNQVELESSIWAPYKGQLWWVEVRHLTLFHPYTVHCDQYLSPRNLKEKFLEPQEQAAILSLSTTRLVVA